MKNEKIINNNNWFYLGSFAVFSNEGIIDGFFCQKEFNILEKIYYNACFDFSIDNTIDKFSLFDDLTNEINNEIFHVKQGFDYLYKHSIFNVKEYVDNGFYNILDMAKFEINNHLREHFTDNYKRFVKACKKYEKEKGVSLKDVNYSKEMVADSESVRDFKKILYTLEIQEKEKEMGMI